MCGGNPRRLSTVMLAGCATGLRCMGFCWNSPCVVAGEDNSDWAKGERRFHDLALGQASCLLPKRVMLLSQSDNEGGQTIVCALGQKKGFHCGER